MWGDRAMKKLILLSSTFLFCAQALASLKPIQMSFQSNIPQTRWIFDSKQPIQQKYRALANLKKAQLSQNYSTCRAQGQKLYASQKLLRPWILAVQYDCELNLKASGVSRLRTFNGILKGNPDWLLRGPYKDKLKNQYVESQFAILEWDIKNRPQTAWATVGDLLDLQEWMTKEQKAKAFQMAGELSFLQQNLQTAKAYVLKSLSEVANPTLQDRLKAIESALTARKKGKEEEIKPAEDKDVKTILSSEEEKIVERMTVALKSGDLFSATEDGIALIRKYPGSVHSDWAAQRVRESYVSITQQNEKRFKVLRYDFINVMKKADSKRIYEWAQTAYRLGQYKDAVDLAEEAYSKAKSDAPSVEILNLLAKAAIHNNDHSTALKNFKILAEKYSGTRESVEAYFYMGLLKYIAKDYAKGSSDLERVVSQTQYSDLELMARYWLWRSVQKIDAQRAAVEAQMLIQRFPLTYYGLLAVADLNKGEVSFESLNVKDNQKQSLWLTPQEKTAWDRLQILLAAGWFEEASAELEQIPAPENPEGIAMLARYYAAAFNYPKAIRMLNSAWDEDDKLRTLPLIQVAYPREFSGHIEEQANARKVDPNFVLSLIRQESSFNVFAISRSNAMGLMQMIPPTAREIAQDLKIKNFNLEKAMFDPPTNIRMGTYYFSRMISRFDGNIPFALAAYNAGPTRLNRWAQSAGFSPQPTSSPEYEVWIDLLPWNETRFYVKAILRNYLIYQLLDGKKVQVQNPVWGSASK